MRINLAFADASTVLPAFIDKLSGSPLLVGLTGSMMTAGWMWPQLLMSNVLEHRPRKMPFYALGMSVRVLAWLAVFFCTITIGEQNPMLLAACFLGFYFLSSSAMGVSTLPYMDIVSKAIEPQRRARFFSLRQLYGGFFAIWVGFLVRAVLGNEAEFTGILGAITRVFKTVTMYFICTVCHVDTDLGFPYNYAFLFICSVLAAFLSFISFLGVREPIHPVHATRQPLSQHLKQGPRFFRTDRNYRRFIFFRIGAHFSGMASPFYIPYALNELGVSEGNYRLFHRVLCTERCRLEHSVGTHRREIRRAVAPHYHRRTDDNSADISLLIGNRFCLFTTARLFPDFYGRWGFRERHDGRVHVIYAKHRATAPPSELHRIYEHGAAARESRAVYRRHPCTAHWVSVAVRHLHRPLSYCVPHSNRAAGNHARRGRGGNGIIFPFPLSSPR